MRKPVDRCACIEGITGSILLNCIILPFVHVYAWVWFASWKVQSSFFSFFASHAAFWNLCEVIIPVCKLCCLEILAVLCWTGTNKTAFSHWESDLSFFISPKLEPILILWSLHSADLDSDCHAHCSGEKKSHLYICKLCIFGEQHTYCTEILQC